MLDPHPLVPQATFCLNCLTESNIRHMCGTSKVPISLGEQHEAGSPFRAMDRASK